MISIIIPVYNTNITFLKKCLDSIVNQTDKSFEAIIVNDGSSKKIKDFFHKYESKNIRVINKNNTGVSDTRNVGIKASKYDYVTFLDSDDYLEKDAVEKINNYINGSDILVFPCNIVYKNKIIKNEFYDKEEKNIDKREFILQSIEKGFTKFYPKVLPVCVTFSKVYRKEFLIKNNIIFNTELKMFEDLIFNIYAFEKANQIDYIDYIFYNQISNNSSISNKTDYSDYEKCFNEIKKFIGEDKIYNNALDLRKVISFNYYINKYSKKYILKLRNKYIYELNNINYNNLNLYQKIFIFLIKHKLIYCAKILDMIKWSIKNEKKF